MHSDPDYAKKWRAKQDPEKRRAYARAYRLKNIERVRGYAKKYSDAYKEKIKLRNKARPCAEGKPETFSCKACGVVKPFDNVNFPDRDTNKFKLGYVCRSCKNYSALSRAVKRKYGMTYDEATAFRSAPCFICRSTHRVHIDHSHKTGLVRKPLCSLCNNGLGCFRDNPEWLRAAAIYIEDHE